MPRLACPAVFHTLNVTSDQTTARPPLNNSAPASNRATPAISPASCPLLPAPSGSLREPGYSHSIVAGGLLLMS